MQVDAAGEAGEGDDIDEADEEDDDGDDDDDQDLTKLQLVAKATAALPQESSDHYTVMQSLHEAASDTGRPHCTAVQLSQRLSSLRRSKHLRRCERDVRQGDVGAGIVHWQCQRSGPHDCKEGAVMPPGGAFNIVRADAA